MHVEKETTPEVLLDMSSGRGEASGHATTAMDMASARAISSRESEGEEMGARGRGLGFRVRGSRLVGGGGGGVVDAWPVPWQMASTIPLSSCSEEGDELGGLGLF